MEQNSFQQQTNRNHGNMARRKRPRGFRQLLIAGWLVGIIMITGLADNGKVKVNGTLLGRPDQTYTINWQLSRERSCGSNSRPAPLLFGRLPAVTTNSEGRARLSLEIKMPPGLARGFVRFSAVDSGGTETDYEECVEVGEGS